MFTSTRSAGLAALVLVLAAGGIFLIGRSSNALGPGPGSVSSIAPSPSPQPSASASPSPAASVAADATASAAPTPSGRRITEAVSRSTELRRKIRFSAPGWTWTEDAPSSVVLVPPDAGSMDFQGSTLFDNVSVYLYPIAGSADGDLTPLDGVGTSAKALSDWLSKRPQLTTTSPKPAKVGRLAGYTLDIKLSDTAGGLCGSACVNLFNNPANEYSYGIVAPTTARIFLLDFSGGDRVVLIAIEDLDGKDAASTFSAGMKVLDTLDFPVSAPG